MDPNPDINPSPNELSLHVLDPEIGIISSRFRISPDKIHELNRTLPLKIILNPGLQANGSVTVSRIKNRPTAVITLKSAQPDDHADTDTKLEEIIHWIHLAHNPELTRQKAESSSLPLNLSGCIPDSALLMAGGLIESSRQEIDTFCQVTGIPAPGQPQTEKEIRQALIIATQPDHLTFSQAASLFRELSGRPQTAGLMYLSDQEVSELQSRFEAACHELDTLTDVDPGKYHHAEWRYEQQTEIQKLVSQKLKLQVNETVSDLLNQPDSVPFLAATAAASGISLDSLTYRKDSVNTMIDSLPADRLLTAVTGLLNTDSFSLFEMIHLAGAGNYIKLDPFRRLISDDPSPEKVVQIKQEIADDIRQLPPTLTSDQITTFRTVLHDLFNRRLKIAAAKARFNSDAMLYFDDLPPEGTTARFNLLGNPEYMGMLRQAMLDPANGPLSSVNMDPEKFIASPDYASATTSAIIRTAFEHPKDVDISHFVATEKSILENYPSTGSPPDQIETDYHKLLERISIRQKATDTTPNPTPNDSAVAALSESIHHKLQDIDTGTDLLLEPIAKEIVHQLTGRKALYPSIMGVWHVYSPLLTENSGSSDNSLNAWHIRLGQFVQRIMHSGDWNTLIKFFKAGSIAEQDRLINQ